MTDPFGIDNDAMDGDRMRASPPMAMAAGNWPNTTDVTIKTTEAQPATADRPDYSGNSTSRADVIDRAPGVHTIDPANAMTDDTFTTLGAAAGAYPFIAKDSLHTIRTASTLDTADEDDIATLSEHPTGLTGGTAPIDEKPAFDANAAESFGAGTTYPFGATGATTNSNRMSDADLRTNLQMLETKLAASGAIGYTAGLRENLEQLESKAVGASGVTGDIVLRSNLQMLETKLAASSTLSPSTAGLRANLEQLESKAVGTSAVSGGDAVLRAKLEMLETKLAVSGTLSMSTTGLRANLEQLESEVMVAAGVAVPGGAVLRAKLEMLETKLAASGTIGSPGAGVHSSLENLESKRMGSVKVVSAIREGQSDKESSEGKLVNCDADANANAYADLLNLQDEITKTAGKRREQQLERRMVVGALNSDSHTTPGAYAQVPTEEDQNRRLLREILRQENTEIIASVGTTNPTTNIEAAVSMSAGIGLSEAKPVSDEENLEIGVALQSASGKLQDHVIIQRRTILVAVFCCLLVVVVVIVAILAVSEKQNVEMKEAFTKAEPTGSPTMIPTNSPTMAPTAFIAKFPEVTLQAMKDPDSPQAQAYTWLRNDPVLNKYSEAKRMQRMALATLYYATAGESWTLNTDWMSYRVDECEWHSKFNLIGGGEFTPYSIIEANIDVGIASESLCDDQGNYLELVLNTNNLVGTIPNEIALLTSLGRLNIHDNGLSGTLPTELGLMTNLKEVLVSGKHMTGSIPTEFGLMTRLVTWVMSRMALTGTIPSEVVSLTNLQTLRITGTQISGTIPNGMERLQALINFELNACLLEGSLPSELGLLRKLEILLVPENLLIGTIPTEIGALTSMKELYMSTNMLEGTIPSELGLLSNLTEFATSSNFLSGSIPSETGLAKSLFFFSVSNNLLSGTVPFEFWQLPDLWGVFVAHNGDLGGTIPTEIGLISSLTAFFAHQTSFSGTIPSELGMPVSLQAIAFSEASLTGTIPTEFAVLQSLAMFLVDGNSLSGTFPYEIANQRPFASLWLNGTDLTGEIPAILCETPDLYFDCPAMCGCDCACDNNTEMVNASSIMLASSGNGGR